MDYIDLFITLSSVQTDDRYVYLFVFLISFLFLITCICFKQAHVTASKNVLR